MTREEVIEQISELFFSKYGIRLTDYPEETDVVVFAEINDRLDSIEFMNFIFDVEDMFEIGDAGDNGAPTKLGELYDMFETAILEKEQKG